MESCEVCGHHLGAAVVLRLGIALRGTAVGELKVLAAAPIATEFAIKVLRN